MNLSDQEMVMCTRKKITIQSEEVTFTGRSYKNYNKEVFTENLLNQNWQGNSMERYGGKYYILY